MTDNSNNRDSCKDGDKDKGSSSRRKPFDPGLRPDPYDYGPGDSSPYPLTSSDLDCS